MSRSDSPESCAASTARSSSARDFLEPVAGTGDVSEVRLSHPTEPFHPNILTGSCTGTGTVQARPERKSPQIAEIIVWAPRKNQFFPFPMVTKRMCLGRFTGTSAPAARPADATNEESPPSRLRGTILLPQRSTLNRVPAPRRDTVADCGKRPRYCRCSPLDDHDAVATASSLLRRRRHGKTDAVPRRMARRVDEGDHR